MQMGNFVDPLILFARSHQPALRRIVPLIRRDEIVDSSTENNVPVTSGNSYHPQDPDHICAVLSHPQYTSEIKSADSIRYLE